MSLAERIRAYIKEHPEKSSRQVARALGCADAYVRRTRNPEKTYVIDRRQYLKNKTRVARKNLAHYHQKKSDPEWLAQRRKRSRESARRCRLRRRLVKWAEQLGPQEP